MRASETLSYGAVSAFLSFGDRPLGRTSRPLNVGLRLGLKPSDLGEGSGGVRSSWNDALGRLPLHEDRLAQAHLDALESLGIQGEDVSWDRFQADLQIFERRPIVACQIERLVLSPALLPPFESCKSFTGESQDALFGKELGEEGFRVSPRLLTISPHRPMEKIYALKRLEIGSNGLEVRREMGISEQTLYNWKRKYGGMGLGELRRLKQLEEENRKLKQLVADLSLDKHILQEVVRKKL